MIFPIAFSQQYFHYLLRQDVTKLYITIAIRNLAVGMVSIFAPIYMYEFFHESLPLTLLYFGVMFGLYGMLAVLGGKLLGKIGSTRTMIVSSFFLIAHYISLFFLEYNYGLIVIPASLITAAIAMAMFWPAFHTDFSRFSSQESRGKESSRVNVAMILPTILSPLIGGAVLTVFGFPVLFTIVAIVLFASALPLFFRAEYDEVYTDNYQRAWGRIFKKRNYKNSIAFMSDGLEMLIHFYVWPIFLFVIAVNFSEIGGITSFTLVASSIFMLYVGRIADTEDRSWLLNVGAVMTGMAWILKSFITGVFDALLAQTIYRIARGAATVPFRAFFYEKAASKGAEADEFVIYREIVMNIGRFFFFAILAGIFFVFPELPIQLMFVIAAFLSIGLVFLGGKAANTAPAL